MQLNLNKNIILLLSLVTIIIAGGCGQHAKSKAEAINNWDSARNNIALDLAGKQMENGQLDQAVQTLQDTLQHTPKLIDGWILLAQVYQQKDMPIKSQQCLEHALTIQPSHSEANYQMGIIKEIAGDTSAALECYQKASKQSPDNLDYAISEAQLLLEMGRTSDAEPILQNQIKLGRNSIELLMTTGNLYLHKNRLPEAVTMFSTAFQKDPQNKIAADKLCYVLMKNRQYSMAASHIEQVRVSQNRENDQNLLLALGDCYLYTEQYLQAQRCYETLLRDSGPKVIYYVRTAQASLGRNDYSRAEKSCKSAIQMQSDNEEAAVLLAVVYLKQEKITECLTTITSVLAANPQSTIAWCIKGKAYNSLGNTKKAYECYKKAKDISPEDPVTADLLGELKDYDLSENNDSQIPASK